MRNMYQCEKCGKVFADYDECYRHEEREKQAVVMWRVIVLFNESLYEDEEETTTVTEKIFDTYWAMRDYVVTCESQGAVGGMVMKYHPQVDKWTYYMDI